MGLRPTKSDEGAAGGRGINDLRRAFNRAVRHGWGIRYRCFTVAAQTGIDRDGESRNNTLVKCFSSYNLSTS
jgi:hypothetical protein